MAREPGHEAIYIFAEREIESKGWEERGALFA